MGQLNDGGNHGRAYEKEWRVGVTSSTMGFSPNSIRTGRCTCISLKRLVLKNGFSRTVVHLSGWDLSLMFKRWSIPARWLNTSQNTWQSRFQLLTGLRVSIGLGSVGNGRSVSLWIHQRLHGQYFSQFPRFMMSCDIGKGSDLASLIRVQSTFKQEK